MTSKGNKQQAEQGWRVYGKPNRVQMQSLFSRLVTWKPAFVWSLRH